MKLKSLPVRCWYHQRGIPSTRVWTKSYIGAIKRLSRQQKNVLNWIWTIFERLDILWYLDSSHPSAQIRYWHVFWTISMSKKFLSKKRILVGYQTLSKLSRDHRGWRQSIGYQLKYVTLILDLRRCLIKLDIFFEIFPTYQNNIWTIRPTKNQFLKDGKGLNRWECGWSSLLNVQNEYISIREGDFGRTDWGA